MGISISLWSAKEGEIKRFLDSYDKESSICTDQNMRRWMTDFHNPLDSIDMISALMDNKDCYEMTMYIHMENGYLHKITQENFNDVIKGLVEIYYDEAKSTACDYGLVETLSM